MLETGKIINGDCIEVMKTLPDGCVDLLVTSPPYNANIKYDVYDDGLSMDEYWKFTTDWLLQAFRLLKDDGRVAINVPIEMNVQERGGRILFNAEFWMKMKEVGFKFGKWLDLKMLQIIFPTPKIVKCVFGSDRRRVSAYSIVLRTALAKQLQVADIPNFIRESGGVEEVRLMKSPNAMTAKQKAEVGAVTLTNKTIINVTAPAFKEALDAGNIGKPVVLIGTWNADGSISVHSFSNSAGAVNAALVVQFAQAKLKTEAQKVETTAANDSQIAKDAVTQAVSEATALPIAA
jgi:hypothetical protein